MLLEVGERGYQGSSPNVHIQVQYKGDFQSPCCRYLYSLGSDDHFRIATQRGVIMCPPRSGDSSTYLGSQNITGKICMDEHVHSSTHNTCLNPHVLRVMYQPQIPGVAALHILTGMCEYGVLKQTHIEEVSVMDKKTHNEWTIFILYPS